MRHQADVARLAQLLGLVNAREGDLAAAHAKRHEHGLRAHGSETQHQIGNGSRGNDHQQRGDWTTLRVRIDARKHRKDHDGEGRDNHSRHNPHPTLRKPIHMPSPGYRRGAGHADAPPAQINIAKLAAPPRQDAALGREAEDTLAKPTRKA